MSVHVQQMFDIRKQLKAELKVREEMVVVHPPRVPHAIAWGECVCGETRRWRARRGLVQEGRIHAAETERGNLIGRV